MRPLIAALLLVSLAGIASAAPLSPEQAVRFRRASGLTFSPDGSRLACVVSEFVDGKSRTHLWKLEGAELVPWTNGTASDRAPQWSPDGSALAFLSTRAGGSQIHVMAPDSGDASVRALTRAPHGVTAFRWSPDGEQLAFLAREADAEGAGDPQLFDREEDLERLWIIEARTRETRRLTSGRWRIESFAWTSNDRLVAQATNRPESDAWSDALYEIAASDGRFTLLGRPAQPFGGLTVSPDGSRLGFTAPRNGGPNPHDLHLQSSAGGRAVDVTAALDRPVKTLHWQNDSTVVFSVTDGFFYRLHRITGRGAPAPIALPMSARDFDVARDGTIAYAGNSFEKQAEVFLRAPDGTVRQISHLQKEWEGVPLAPAEIFRFASFDRRPIEAALLRPPGLAGRLPLILLVHGGPGSSFDASSTYWFGAWAQVLVSHGY